MTMSKCFKYATSSGVSSHWVSVRFKGEILGFGQAKNPNPPKIYMIILIKIIGLYSNLNFVLMKPMQLGRNVILNYFCCTLF